MNQTAGPKMNRACVTAGFQLKLAGRRCRPRKLSGFTGPYNSALPGKSFPGGRLGKRIAVLPPREVAILAVKFLGENPNGEKNTGQPGSDELPGQLRILDPRRFALRTPDRG